MVSGLGKPNGLTLDTLQISYDRLPDGIEERVATLTVSDSISTYDIKVTQNVNGVSSIEKLRERRLLFIRLFSTLNLLYVFLRIPEVFPCWTKAVGRCIDSMSIRKLVL